MPLKAREDVQHAALIGSIFGGREGSDYLKGLIDIGWDDEPEKVEDLKRMVDDADRNRESHGQSTNSI